MDRIPRENSWHSQNGENARYYNFSRPSRQDSESSGYLVPQTTTQNSRHLSEMAANIPDAYMSTNVTSGTKHYNEIFEYEECAIPDKEHLYEPLSPVRPERKKLDLSAKCLTILPNESINNGIEVLILDNNAFLELPMELFKFENLVYLSATSQILPKRASVSHWPALGQISEEIRKLKNLAYLVLFNNALRELPKGMANLDNLIHLDLKLNWFSEFPICICKIKSLKELQLSGNHIKEVPKEIKQLENLQVFRIGNNDLRSIPDEICILVKLTCLSLRNNKLEQLPSDMYKLKGLLPSHVTGDTKLLLGGNPLKYPPEKIINDGTEAVFNYLKRNPKPTETKEKRPSFKDKSTRVKKTDDIIASERRLEIVVKEQGLLFRQPTPKDGNCFFHAVSDQLQRPNMNLRNHDHSQLRTMLVNYLKEGSDQSLSQWIKEVSSKPVEVYVKNMSMDGIWADDIAITVMARVLQRDIWIIPSSPDQIKANTASFDGHLFKGGEGKQLIIGHLYEHHYQSLDTIEDIVEEDIHNDGNTKIRISHVESPEIPAERKTKTTASHVDCLDLSGRKLENLSLDILSPDTVSTLLLNDNCLLDGKWVQVVRKLTHLKKLSMRSQDEKVLGNACKYNILGRIPENIYVLKNLTHLCMAKNKITSIPIELTYLENLQMLDLINNSISTVPEKIEDCRELEYLGLSNNQISSLPKSIGNLVNLQVLRLSNNKLLELPETVCNLRKLFVLSLSNNELVYLPPDLHCLELLKSKTVYKCSILERTSFKAGLLIEGNKSIMFPDKGICEEGIDSIFDFLLDMERRPKARKDLVQRAKFFVQEQTSSREPKARVVPNTDSTYKHLTPEFIDRLADNVGKEWKMIGRHLNLKPAHIDHCEMSNPGNIREAIIKMFEKWRDSKIDTESEDKLILDLIKVLGEVGRSDLKDKLLKQYKKLSGQ